MDIYVEHNPGNEMFSSKSWTLSILIDVSVMVLYFFGRITELFDSLMKINVPFLSKWYKCLM